MVEGSSSVVLASSLNPESGGLMWVEEEDASETYNMIVSMSQMTSMLRDTDRNAAYEHGICRGIAAFIAQHHRPPIVLDIGTGTGLLALLAAKYGAAHVYACEMFERMAAIAVDVVADNALQNKITVIPKRSTDLKVPEDLPVKADILVSELFDSLLLGEGLLPTLTHARVHLLVDNPIIIPQEATVYATLVQSPSILNMHSFEQAPVKLYRDEQAKSCAGGRTALPLHVTSPVLGMTNLTNAEPILHFDFTNVKHYCPRQFTKWLVTTTCGRMDGIAMHWSIDFGGDVIYCTAPGGSQQWQDHWVPVVFPLSIQDQRALQVGNAVEISVRHDALRIWLDIVPAASDSKKSKNDDEYSAAPCTCGLHLICNAERISMLVNAKRHQAYKAAIISIVQTHKIDRVLDVSDGSFCALIAAAAGAPHVTSIESKDVSARIFEQIARGQHMDEQMSVLCCGVKGLAIEHLHGYQETQMEDGLVQLVVGEPFYYAMQNLPIWQALNFWYRRSAVDRMKYTDASSGYACFNSYTY